jgi:hypothetical protein
MTSEGEDTEKWVVNVGKEGCNARGSTMEGEASKRWRWDGGEKHAVDEEEVRTVLPRSPRYLQACMYADFEARWNE